MRCPQELPEEQMKTQRRWMTSVLTEAAACKVRMPWERGLRRGAMIARRKALKAEPLRRSA